MNQCNQLWVSLGLGLGFAHFCDLRKLARYTPQDDLLSSHLNAYCIVLLTAVLLFGHSRYFAVVVHSWIFTGRSQEAGEQTREFVSMIDIRIKIMCT
jgi:hypothetical protein